MSPGYLPFAEALDLPAYLCDNCGFSQRHFEPPPSCPLCLDARHVVPQSGWRFWTEAEARERFPCHWAEVETGIWRFWNDPVSGIGPSAYLVTSPGGNMMFEGCSVFSEAALAQIASLGGVDVLSASHPHSYGAIWQIQDRFDPELALPAGDFTWSAALRVSWPYDDRLEPLPGLELYVTGGHFDGHAVLFDRERKILFCGDALKFELDPADPRRALTISAHKAFVRGVPLTSAELARYRAVFAPLDFRQTWTPFEQAQNSGRAEALALIDRLLAVRPHAAPVPLSDLLVSRRMEEISLAREKTSIRTRDGECPTHILKPDGEGRWPAVIVYMDAGGIRPAMVDMAERLAGAGYVVLLPDLFYRYGPYGPFVPKEVFKGDFRAILGPLMATTGNDKAAEDTGAFLSYLATRGDVAGKKVGAVGFCMGGGMAMTAAGTYPDRFGAVASFHGGNLATDAPTSPHLLAPRLEAEIYIGAAENDNSYPPAMAKRLETALAEAGVRCRAETYPAAHGWMMTDFPVYDHAAAERGWSEMLALFSHLGEATDGPT